MMKDYQFSAYWILDKQRDPTAAGEKGEVEIGDGNWGGRKKRCVVELSREHCGYLVRSMNIFDPIYLLSILDYPE